MDDKETGLDEFDIDIDDFDIVECHADCKNQIAGYCTIRDFACSMKHGVENKTV